MNVMTDKQKSDCRKYARQVWREEPSVSAEDMIKRTEIIDVACAGTQFTTSQLYDAIRPLDASTDELVRLKELKMWQLDEAVATWCDINPFIVNQARKSGRTQFWNTAFHPSLRMAFTALYEKAERSAHAQELKAIQTSNNDFLVTPEDFYTWAMIATDGPNGDRPTNFFEELKSTWPNHIKPVAPPEGSINPHIKIHANDQHNKVSAKEVSDGPLAEFRAMQNLTCEELSITFFGDKEDYLMSTNMLEISARGVIKRIPVAAFGLVNNHSGKTNFQGQILFSMTLNKKLLSSKENITRVKRLRDLFKIHLGITHDPFLPYQSSYGWMPRFKLQDRRGAADIRAKRQAEIRTVSYDDDKNNTVEQNDEDDMGVSFNSDVNSADDWMKSVGRGWGDDIDPDLL